MKRSGFKRPTLEKIIAAQSKPRKPLKSSKLTKAKRKGGNKVKVHWKPPAWFMVIPTGSHGSNPVQKRLWKLTSDYVRIFDAENHGVCVSCDNKIDSWKDGDCGHYKGWTSCNVYFKFARINLSWQCSYCNRLSDGSVGFRFSQTLKKRHGDHVLSQIETDNKTFHGGKFENIILVEMAKELVEEFKKNTSQKPDYFESVLMKMEELSPDNFAYDGIVV